MPDNAKTLPLERSSVQSAHEQIKQHIHCTPVLTSTTLSKLASTPQSPEALVGTPFEGQEPARPKINFFFKCENYQRIGAFKIRGAFHALSRLSKEELSRGVVTHSSGNHAQALALAARTYGIPAHVVMPTISTPSKIAATQGYGAKVYFSGSTSEEREAVVHDIMKQTNAVLIPPYDHPDIILGQGTLALELEEQTAKLIKQDPTLSIHHTSPTTPPPNIPTHLDAVIAPLGGGGLLSGIATALSPTRTAVFGAEPSHQGADDARRGLASGIRIPTVSTLTIADGLRTPVGVLPWTIISDTSKVRAVYAVTENQIRDALRLVLERMKVVVEPSAVVGLAVALFDEGFRGVVEREGGGWNLGVVFSGGNMTVEGLGRLFGEGEAETEGGRGKKGGGEGEGEGGAEGVVG